jgi:hypothetical protein
MHNKSLGTKTDRHKPEKTKSLTLKYNKSYGKGKQSKH